MRTPFRDRSRRPLRRFGSRTGARRPAEPYDIHRPQYELRLGDFRQSQRAGELSATNAVSGEAHLLMRTLCALVLLVGAARVEIRPAESVLYFDFSQGTADLGPD